MIKVRGEETALAGEAHPEASAGVRIGLPSSRGADGVYGVAQRCAGAVRGHEIGGRRRTSRSARHHAEVVRQLPERFLVPLRTWRTRRSLSTRLGAATFQIKPLQNSGA